MTTVITRLCADERAATFTQNRLLFRGLPRSAVRVITKAKDGDVVAKLTKRGVEQATAEAYAAGIARGNAVLMVLATYKPLGAAALAREVLGQAKTIDMGDLVEETWVKDGPDHATSVMKDHPHFLTLPVDDLSPRGPVSREFGMALLSSRKPRTSAMHGGRFMSGMFWPMPLLSKNRRASSAISGGRHMSQMFWPMALLSKKPRRKSVISGGAIPLSRMLSLPTISR